MSTDLVSPKRQTPRPPVPESERYEGSVSFRLDCIPPTTAHHAKRIVKIGGWSRMADKPELVKAKGLLEELLIPHQIPAPIRGPVTLSIEYTWPWLAGHGKRIRALGRIPHTSKPDLTNVTKTLEDRLKTLQFFEDDQRVVDLHVTKWWGNTPGIAITIAPFIAAAAAAEPPSDSPLPLLDADALQPHS